VHHVAGDALFLVHHGEGLFRVVVRVAYAAALSVGGERSLELISKAEVIHDQAAGLVFEYAVHSGDGLHEAVALHRLAGIHRVQAGRAQAGHENFTMQRGQVWAGPLGSQRPSPTDVEFPARGQLVMTLPKGPLISSNL